MNTPNYHGYKSCTFCRTLGHPCFDHLAHKLTDRALIASGVSKLALEILSDYEAQGKDWQARAYMLASAEVDSE